MSWQKLQGDLADTGYVASDDLAMALYLAVTLGKPLLLEGPAGVGKTQIAKTLAELHDTRLIRLQCYEGLDASHAIYEWNYQRQLLSIRAAAEEHKPSGEIEDHIFSEKFLLKRPLLEAIRQDRPAVLLIDEIDRADEEFEAYLLEILSDFQITIPEIGTIRAQTPPTVIVTSNRTREVHDALKRRCLYHWVEHPDLEREVAILQRRLPGLGHPLAEQIARAVRSLREQDLLKPPGIAESLDWARALVALDRDVLDAATAAATLGAVLKYREDIDRVTRAGLDPSRAG